MATTTVMCLFREPLPPGKVSSTTASVTEVHVEEDDRRVAEITIKKPEKSLADQFTAFGRRFVGADAKLGNVELVIPEATDAEKENTPITVTWRLEDEHSFWMQTGGDVPDLISPILRKCLDTGNQFRMEKILQHLKSKSIFRGHKHWKDGMRPQQTLQVLRQALSGKLSPLAKICLCESQPVMSLLGHDAAVSSRVRSDIAGSAVHDVLWLLQQGQFNCDKKYYGLLTPGDWDRLPQHERLAIAHALRPHIKNLKSGDRNDALVDGWEQSGDHALAAYVHEKVRNSIQLSIQISRIRVKRHDLFHVNVVGPFSLAVYSVIAAISVDRTQPIFHVWPDNEASKVACAAKLAFDCLCEVVQNTCLDNTDALTRSKSTFMDGLTRSAPGVICRLGPGAEQALQGVLSTEEIRLLVIDHEFSKNQTLLHLCKMAARSFPCTHGPEEGPSLAHMVLRKTYRLEKPDALRCISAICLGGPSRQDAEEIVALRLLNAVTDTGLAHELAENVWTHAAKNSREMIHNVDWKNCAQTGLPALIALTLAGCWLESYAKELLHIAIDVGETYHDYSLSYPKADLVILESILNFALSARRKAEQTNYFALTSLVEQKFENNIILDRFRRHAAWTQKMSKAVRFEVGSCERQVRHLEKQLCDSKDSIPLVFIRFVTAEIVEAQEVHNEGVAQVYRKILLGGTDASKFKIFLPATEDAERKSAAAQRLSLWLEQTIRNGVSDSAKDKILKLQESIRKAKHPSFPECLGGEDINKDSALQDAVLVFMDNAHPTIGNSGSDFIDHHARQLLRDHSDTEDPLKVPVLAQEKAKQAILKALQGRASLDEVRLQVLDSDGAKREHQALIALLDKEAFSRATLDLFLRLVQLDPSRLLGWAQKLFEFLSDHLQLTELPPGLAEYLDTYRSADIKKLKVFGSDMRTDSADMRTDSERAVAPSIHHMLATFQGIFKDVKPAAWPQIGSLADLSSLVVTFREKIQNKAALERKMNVLRMMCVTNRSMTKAVNILDDLQPSVFVIATSKRHETVVTSLCALLNSGVINQAAAGNISLSQLCGLFSFADGGDDIAKRNAELLRSARIVIDVQRLRRYAEDTFSQKKASDTVRVETGQQNGPKFRLAGGHTCFKVIGVSDIESLFVEVRIQLSAILAQKQQSQDSNSEPTEIADLIRVIDEIHKRVQKVFDLAEHIFTALSFGGDLIGEQSVIDFPSQTPEKSRSLYEDATDSHEIDHLHDIKPFWHKIESPSTLSEKLSTLKTRFPFTSFACPLDIIKRKDTRWIKMLGAIAAKHVKGNLDETGQPEPSFQASSPTSSMDYKLHAYFGALISEKVVLPRSPATVQRNIDARNLPPGERWCEKVWEISCRLEGNGEDTIPLQMLGLLSKFAPSVPSPTSIFPCDASTTSTAISGMTWRLKRASSILDEGEHDVARRLESIFLCSGIIVVTRPDTLDARQQDTLLAGLEQYSKSAGRSVHSCPIVAVLLPNTRNRFSDLMQSMNEVRQITHDMMGIGNHLEGSRHKGQKVRSRVKIVFLDLFNMSRGIRPVCVPENAFRIRLGIDSSIADLVCSLRDQDSYDCISFDFGGDARAIAQSPLAPALVSLLLTGVIGQSQHASEVISSNIYFEFGASSKADLIQQFPILSMLDDKTFLCGDPTERPQGTEVDADATGMFDGLATRAEEKGDVKDEDVHKVLRKLFKADEADAMQAPSRMPFIHTRQSLHIMGRIAREHTLRQVGSETENTHRVQALSPILLSGDTGTGKTYLLFKYLELLRSSGALKRLSNDVSIFTLSAKFLRSNVENLGEKMRDTIREAHGRLSQDEPRTLLTFILDEVTSSPAQEVLARLLCHREIKNGQVKLVRLPRQALVFATCNPDPIRDSVFPLMLEADKIKISMDPLSVDESHRFIQCQLEDDKRGPGFQGQILKDAVEMLQTSKKCFESSTPRIGTTSLRDAVRCASLSRFLEKEFCHDNGDDCSIFGALEKNEKVRGRLEAEDGWAVRGELRSLCLACYLCFGMRIVERWCFFQAIEQQCGHPVERFVNQVRTAIVDSISLPSSVVRTSALEDNLFAGVIAIAARLPLLCLGCDGTSKTLSLNLLLSQMQGKLSGSHLLQGLARVQTFHLQLSERSVAKNVTDLKKTVVHWKSDKMASSIPCIFMEEMSMAEAGPTGPLRALHDLLDAHQDSPHQGQDDASGRRVGTGTNTFAFVATSNYKAGSNDLPIGRALGNRFLVLAHEPLRPETLVDLAVKFGLNKLSGSHVADVQSALTESVRTVCQRNLVFPPSLVPDVISIRSLLFYSQFLALRYEATVLSGQDACHQTTLASTQVAAFAAHLQPLKMDLCRNVLESLGSSFWGSDLSEPGQVSRHFRREPGLTLPSIKDLIRDSFGACRTRRPLLFLYESPLQIHEIVKIVLETYKDTVKTLIKQSPEQEAELVKLHDKENLKLCPSVHSLVHGSYRNTASTRTEQSGESLHTMLQIKSKVERGGVIFILNPEPVIEGIHALLNDCAEDHSTVQLRGAYENVNVDPSSQLVLMVEKRSCLSLHRALLSRVAVMNTGFLDWGEKTNHSRVGKHTGHHVLLAQHYKGRPFVLTDPWLAREVQLLDDMESPLDEFITSLLPSPAEPVSKSESTGRLAIIGVSGKLPLSLQRKENKIFFVEAIKHSTPASFLSEVTTVLDRLETASDIERRTILLDLTSASSVGTVEILTLLGFSGLNFKSAVCNLDLGPRLLRLAARQDRRVCIIVDVFNASSCISGHFHAWKPKPGEPKAPRMSTLISYREIREMSRSYPDWPRLSEFAKDPSLAWERSIDVVLDEIAFFLQADAVRGDGDGEEKLRQQELASPAANGGQRDLAALALKYFLPERICKTQLLCPNVRIDFGDDVQSAELHSTRVHHFEALLRKVLEEGGVSSSLRMAFIQGCRKTATRVAAMMVQCLPASLLLSPTAEWLAFLKGILASRTFSWQQSEEPLRTLERNDEFPFLPDILRVLRGKQQVLGPPVWSSCDGEEIQKTLSEAFPTLRDCMMQWCDSSLLSSKLRNSLISNLRVRRGDVNKKATAGVYASQLLRAVSDGSFHDTLSKFIVYEDWILVLTHMKLRLSADVWTHLSNAHEVLPHVCTVVLESLRHADTHLEDLWINDAKMFHRYAKRVEDAIARSEMQGRPLPAAVLQIRQVIKIWRLLDTFHKASKGTILQHLEVANSVLTDGEKAGHLFSGPRSSRDMIMTLSVLDDCDALEQLPNKSIARAVTNLGLKGRGFALLASCACRRGSGSVAAAFILTYLEIAYESPGESVMPANCEATILAAEALNQISTRVEGFFEDVLTFLSDLAPVHTREEDSAWCAMRLAAASICVPHIVLQRIHLIMETEARTQRQKETRKAISHLFQSQVHGGVAIRSFLVRCLVSRFDERGLASCGVSVKTVGDWIQAFLTESTEGEMEGMLAVPGFDENLAGCIDDEWPNALRSALQLDDTMDNLRLCKRCGRGTEIHECGCVEFLEPAEQQARDQVEQQARDQRLAADQELKSALCGGSDLGFCRLPCAIWCVLLSSLADKSMLATREYVREEKLGACCFPAAPEGGLELLRRLGAQGMDIRSINRCNCGELYAIGHCGQPMEVGRCPACGNAIGGTGHQYVNGLQFVAAVPQAGNTNVGSHVDRGESDVVRGIDVNWFEAGQGYRERDLEPLEYRILCLLLLMPLAVFSPQRERRCTQLKNHWEAFKLVSGSCSDTDAQHLMLGILVGAAQQPNLLQGLAMADCNFGNVSERTKAEATFCTALRNVLKMIGGRPDKIVHDVQARIKAADRPLRNMREGHIKGLSQEEADRMFAPRVLKVLRAEPERNREEELHAIQQHIARNSPCDFPLLIWSLFDEESDDIELISSSFDLSLRAKLGHLPQLLHYLRLVAQKAAEETHPNFELPVSVLLEQMEMKPEDAGRFEMAWEACRYGQRFECQAVDDLGPLKELQLQDLLLGGGRDVVSRALVLVRNLVEAHNGHVQLLQGPDLHDHVTISLYQAQILDHLVPWSKARVWVQDVVSILPHRGPLLMAKDMEFLLRQWLMQTLKRLVKFSLDDWPLVHPVPAGIVRLGTLEQAVALPHECIAAIDEYVRHHGLLQDRVSQALDILKKIALSIESSPRKISPETLLQDKVFDCRPPPPPSLLDILQEGQEAWQKGKSLGVRVKHLNALQEHLCERMDAKAEDALCTAYRTPLEKRHLSSLETSLTSPSPKHAQDARYLLQKLAALAEMLARNAYPPSHGMCEYLVNIDIQGAAERCEDDGYVELVKELKLEHTFHALSSLRKILSKLEEGET